MEDIVGARWHNLITRLARTGFPDARVTLEDEGPRLAVVFRALGGSPALSIKPSTERTLSPPRPLLQKIAGTGRKHALAWREEDCVRLPDRLQVFPRAQLNRDLYLWLVAMASVGQVRSGADWLGGNQQAVLETLLAYPGLQSVYVQLVDALIELRNAGPLGSAAEQRREACIQAALREPGSQQQLPVAGGDPLPVPLWLYPLDEPLDQAPVSRQQDNEDEGAAAPLKGKVKQGKGRKKAQYVEDMDSKTGMIVFRLESLFSWSEYIPLDRCADDTEDEDAERAADDLEFLSLSRKGDSGNSRLRIDLDLPSASEDDIPLGDGLLLPEWDWRKQKLLANHCRVLPMLPRGAEPAGLPERLKPVAHNLRRRFEGLRPQKMWNKRQPVGSQLDLEACISFTTDRMRGQANAQPALWRQESPQHRDLACLVLADLSLSTDAWADNEHQVIEVIRDSLYLLGEALDAGDDSFALYGFSSRRRDHVRFSLIKNFAEAWGDVIRGRISALRPGYYTRMGAAIRQATEILKEQPAEQRVLLLLTDGKPNDLDIYEGRYGMEDTRHALLEARQAGLEPFCVTIDQQASDYLPYLFGKQRYQLIQRAAELPSLLPKLYLLLTGRTP
ncbi:nitric oxide reductase activation protein NorD [Halopseudomonas yangmingensis]|uniref:Nitric oxide reductase NorD protein n=1 Tax=Halopseudomonas yangmingensis TaxID=1720063 RepID=A0A1I4SHL7_9GAMM|nr:VWA domain-containing protein [Halopseudomonas yangmingensis]SFM63947.1 nitric oxide reductase NorD protein [Halopseudomonas yangmingensis]